MSRKKNCNFGIKCRAYYMLRKAKMNNVAHITKCRDTKKMRNVARIKCHGTKKSTIFFIQGVPKKGPPNHLLAKK